MQAFFHARPVFLSALSGKQAALKVLHKKTPGTGAGGQIRSWGRSGRSAYFSRWTTPSAKAAIIAS